MFKSAIAFIIWGCPGPLLVGFHSDPILMALSRYFFSGIFFAVFWLVLRFVHKGRLRQRLPWKDRDLWISGAIILARNIFYMLSFAVGPAAVAGLIYGYAPLLIPFFGFLLGSERGKKMSGLYWLSLLISFLGNSAIFTGLSKDTVSVGGAAILAGIASICYILTPIFSVRLQFKGMRPKDIVGAQSVVASLISVPCLFLFVAVGLLKLSNSAQVHTTLTLAAIVAIFFTILPFYLWYSGIKTSGLNRVAPMGFLEPLTSSVLSFFILGDAKPNLWIICGLMALTVGFFIAVLDSRRKHP